MSKVFKISGGVKENQAGFTLVEILVSLSIVSLLLLSVGAVVSTTSTINAKTNLNSDASEVAFAKLQDYVNTTFDNVPIGLTGSGYEVEDFSNDPALDRFRNVSAKVYVKPASVVNSGTTVTTNDYSEVAIANTSFSTGSEISVTDVDDPTGCCRYDSRLSDNNYYNLVYNNYDSGSSNQELPAIDLGSPKEVNTIRINWYSSNYTSQNFRIEASNNLSSWTTVASGLSTNVAVGYGTGNYPEDYAVSGNYRYWRMFNVTGKHSTWIAISEMEAFSAASGDVVEQHGSDASSNPGALDFSSSNLEMSLDGTSGHQSVGLRFKNVNLNQGTTITNAYIQFTAAASDSGAVELLATGVDTDNAQGWNGDYAVDNAVAGAGGTTSTSTWNPSAWTSGASGTAQRLNVTGPVQEIINRGGWSNGNSLAVAVQNVSGSGRRVAQKSNPPTLVIEWSETVTESTGGAYVDVNGDGDADNPTLLEVRTVISYDSFGETREVEYTSYIRKYGLSN